MVKMERMDTLLFFVMLLSGVAWSYGAVPRSFYCGVGSGCICSIAPLTSGSEDTNHDADLELTVDCTGSPRVSMPPDLSRLSLGQRLKMTLFRMQGTAYCASDRHLPPRLLGPNFLVMCEDWMPTGPRPPTNPLETPDTTMPIMPVPRAMTMNYEMTDPAGEDDDDNDDDDDRALGRDLGAGLGTAITILVVLGVAALLVRRIYSFFKNF